jgi:hypothetical protein
MRHSTTEAKTVADVATIGWGLAVEGPVDEF